MQWAMQDGARRGGGGRGGYDVSGMGPSVERSAETYHTRSTSRLIGNVTTMMRWDCARRGQVAGGDDERERESESLIHGGATNRH